MTAVASDVETQSATESHPRRACALAGAAIALGLLLASCSPQGAATPTLGTAAGSAVPVASGPPIQVMGTENFYADLLARIGGARVQATSLLNDPNADPHEFESSPQDAALVADASLVIVNGLGYDAFMDRLLRASSRPDRIVINVQQLRGLADETNVHIWYDPATMPAVAASATAALTTLDPANSGYFGANEQAYLASLQTITDKVAGLKARYAGTPIAFTENVAGFLTQRIGLDLRSPLGFMKAVEEGTDPAPADVAAERDLISSRAVRVLVYNSQVASPVTQQIHDLAQANGIPIVGVAETIPPTEPGFVDWQLAQLDALEQALAAGS